MKSKLLPFAAAAVLFVLVMSLSLILALRANNGRFVYALDDAYIHMSIARSFSEQGVWGITRYAFGSSTSSVAWTLMLSGVYRTLGVHESASFVMNMVLAVMLIGLLNRYFGRYKASPAIRTIILTSMMLVIPLPALVFSGMEHILHIIVVLPFVFLSVRLLSNDQITGQHDRLVMLLMIPFLVMIRYESLFLIASIGSLFLLKRRWKYAMAIGLITVLPVMTYGYISVKQGWFWLPNSILLKHSDFSNSIIGLLRLLGYEGYTRLVSTPHLLFLVIASLVVYVIRSISGKDLWESMQLMLSIFVMTTLMHTQFAQVGWLFRYEAYLTTLGLVTLIIIWLQFHVNTPTTSPEAGKYKLLTSQGAALVILGALVMLPFTDRAFSGTRQASQASNDRYYEHISMAKFIGEYYNDSTIAINDIGAVSYFTRAHILDIFGLGSKEPVLFRRQEDGYTSSDLYKWTKKEKAKIAITQIQWEQIEEITPKQWRKVGEWNMPRNVIFGNTRVAFYAVDSSEEVKLIAHLREFSKHLPWGIQESGKYIDR